MGYYKKQYQKQEAVKAYKPKRGNLAPLMTEEDKQQASIHELSYDFACRITRLYQYLTEDAEYKEYVSSKQIYRSGTSVGANVRESKHAQSDADFLSKMSIAYKEADESNYWLNLLHDNGYLNDDQHESLSHDCTRIIKILTSIVKTMRQKLGKEWTFQGSRFMVKGYSFTEVSITEQELEKIIKNHESWTINREPLTANGIGCVGGCKK